MEVKEEYVSYEVAKLLKEKGFDIATEYVYLGDNKGRIAKSFTSHFVKKRNDIIPCPTHQMACAWVRNKGWHISIQLSYDDNYNAVYYITISITKTFLAEDIGELEYKYFSKVEDANDEALKFVLTNM